MSDTSPIAARIQANIHRRLLPADRLRIAMDMSETAHELARSRLRTVHPEWSERQLTDASLRNMLPTTSTSAK